MKQVSMFLLLVATAFLSTSFVAEEVVISLPLPQLAPLKAPERPKVEKLDGKEVVVRVYKDWQEAPAAFEKVSVQVNGDTVHFDFPDITQSTVVLMIGEDQKDAAVKKALGDCIYAEPFKKGMSLSLPAGNQQGRWWKFNDALGNPIPQAAVEIFVQMDVWRGGGPRVKVGEGLLDEQGRLRTPFPVGSLRAFSFVISRPDYGIAEVDRFLQGAIDVPLVRKGTKAYERSAWGLLVDVENNPVSGASIQCREVRTLDDCLIRSFGGWTYKVLSDEEGRFSIYLPNKSHYKEKGNMLPPESKYFISIKAPKYLGLMPYVGKIVNGRETTITMERGGYYRTFVFKDETGQITDPNKLRTIDLTIKRPDKPDLVLKYDDLKDGGVFPLGIYQVRIEGAVRRQMCKFEPLEVTAERPEELVFKLSDDIIYYGQVVDGIIGKPMKGAFVISIRGIGNRNFSQITPEQWEALHALGVEPSVDDEALRALSGIYAINKIVRTDEQGWFAMSLKPGSEWGGIAVFEENYLGVRYRTYVLKPDKDRCAEVPVIKLFPAAKVMIEPYIEEGHASMWPKWLIEKEDNPAWTDTLLAINDHNESSFAYEWWLKQNKAQTFSIPAGLYLRIRLDTLYDTRWCPVIIDEIYAEQGEVINLGRHTFERAIKVCVRVIDPAGTPVEGIPVRGWFDKKYVIVSNDTDENGIAWFNVPPYSKGVFGVHTESEHKLYLKETIPYEVGGEEDAGREFTMTISDEMLYQLFK